MDTSEAIDAVDTNEAVETTTDTSEAIDAADTNEAIQISKTCDAEVTSETDSSMDAIGACDDVDAPDHPIFRVLASTAPGQNTDAWLEWRKKKLTASDCPKIIGNAVKSRERLLNEKKGLVEAWGGNAFTQAGHDFEPRAIRAYEFNKGKKVIADLSPVCHRDYPCLAASLDGATTCGINVEIKCLSDAKVAKKPKPVHVYQVQYQMACAGLTKTHLVYYYLKIDADGDPCDPRDVYTSRAIKIFEIDYDHKWFASNLSKFLDFASLLDPAECECDIQGLTGSAISSS